MTTKEFNVSAEIYKDMVRSTTYVNMDIFSKIEQKEVIKQEENFKKKTKLRNIFKMVNDLKEKRDLSYTEAEAKTKIEKAEFRTQNISLKIKPSENDFFIEEAKDLNFKKGTLIYEILLLGVEVYKNK